MKKLLSIMLLVLLIFSASSSISGCAKQIDKLEPSIESETPLVTPTAPPVTNLREFDYTKNLDMLYPNLKAFVSNREVFAEYALPNESKPFFGYDVKLRLFETEYEDFDKTFAGMQAVVELTSREDRSVMYLKSGFIEYDLNGDFSYAYIAMVNNFCGSDESVYFVSIQGEHSSRTLAFTMAENAVEISGVPYEIGESFLIMKDSTDIIGYKNIFIEYDVYYKDYYGSIDFIERRELSKLEFAISIKDGYPDKKVEDDSVPYHTVLKSFDAFLIGANGKYTQSKIPLGTRVKPVSTDRMGKVYFETNTGKAGYFMLSYDQQGTIFVSGIPQDEVFDNIFNP